MFCLKYNYLNIVEIILFVEMFKFIYLRFDINEVNCFWFVGLVVILNLYLKF